MPFSTIPHELILGIAENLPARDLSVLSRTNSTLTYLLTPLLLGRANQSDFERSIILDRPASIRSILRPPTTISIDRDMLGRNGICASPLHYAAEYRSSALVATLVDLGAPVDQPERDGIARPTTLQCAVLSWRIETVTVVLDAGADVNRVSSYYSIAPLTLACRNSGQAIALLLIDRGAWPTADALAHAAYDGMVPVMERLLDMGLPVDSAYDSGLVEQPLTVLQYMSMFSILDDSRAVELLLRRGADVNRGKNGPDEGYYPLHWCVRSNNLSVVRLLLDFGADRDVLCAGETLPSMAARRGYLEMAELLVQYGR